MNVFFELPLGIPDFSLREFGSRDIESLVHHAANQKVSEYLRDSFPFPYNRSDAKNWIRFCQSDSQKLNLAITHQGNAIGGIGLRMGEDVNRCSAEIGYWLGEEYWGRGVASEAVRVFVNDCFERRGLECVWAEIFAPNRASCKVLEKNGFQHIGRVPRKVIKAGQILDCELYAKARI